MMNFKNETITYKIAINAFYICLQLRFELRNYFMATESAFFIELYSKEILEFW